MRIGEKWLPHRESVEHTFTVHSVFDRIINISTDQGLLSIAAEGTGGCSTFLTIPGKNIDCSVKAGDACVVGMGQMRLSNHTINFKNAALWRGSISKGFMCSRIKQENIAAFKAVLDRKAAPQSAWKIIHNSTVIAAGGADNRFSGLRAIRLLRENPMQARNLIGLGPGLTPAGDDMLLGFLAIANHALPASWEMPENQDFVHVLHGIVSDSLHKTTDISAQMLANSLDCDYHEYVQNCIRDLCEGEKEEVYISAAALLSMGATSGADIACGMYFGMSDNN